MPLSARLLLAATAICCLATLLAFPMDGFVTGQRCRCLATTSKQFLLRSIQRVEIEQPGAHCRNKEILVTLKNNNTVCVSPEAKWIQDLIGRLTGRRKRSA